MSDVKAWIPCNIPASAGRSATRILHVLIIGVAGRWMAEGSERQVVAYNSNPYGAYLALVDAIALQVQKDRTANRVPFELIETAPVSLHRRFEVAENRLSLMTVLTLAGKRQHAVTWQEVSGWRAATLENYIHADGSHANPSAAFTELAYEIQNVTRGANVSNVVNFEPAPPALWAMCASPGHESFGRAVPSQKAA